MNFENILNYIPKLETCEVLDIFAREGSWQTHQLVGKVKSIEAWEIEEKFIENLRKNIPNAKVFCRDSIKFINNSKEYNKFDLLVIDNGLNCYGDSKQYCEHFDVIKSVHKILKNNCFVIFNVVTNPFNYKENQAWSKRRNDFYNVDDASNLSQDFVEKFYKNLFLEMGFHTKNYISFCRELHDEVEYLHYVGMELSNENSNTST
jgi:16S rRNA G966 N2-methylase RsmD